MNILFSQQQLEEICKKNDINFLGLFGSHARNEAKQDSDVDLLVNFKKTKSLFELARVQFSFQDALKKKVDLVLKNSVKERLEPYILKDLQTLYEERN